MNLTILEILRHQRHKHIDFLFLPAQGTGEERQAEALEALEAVDLVPAAELFHERVFGPAVGRPHEHALLDVDEAGFAHECFVLVADVGAHESAGLAAGFAEELAPFVDVGA